MIFAGKSVYPKVFKDVVFVISPVYSHFVIAPEDLWKHEADYKMFDDLGYVEGVPGKIGVYRGTVIVWWDTDEEPDQHFKIEDVVPVIVGETKKVTEGSEG
jgi:hypothetical protein